MAESRFKPGDRVIEPGFKPGDRVEVAGFVYTSTEPHRWYAGTVVQQEGYLFYWIRLDCGYESGWIESDVRRPESTATPCPLHSFGTGDKVAL